MHSRVAKHTHTLSHTQASSEYTDDKVDLEVYLINGKKVTLKVEAFDRSDQVLEVRDQELEDCERCLRMLFSLSLASQQ